MYRRAEAEGRWVVLGSRPRWITIWISCILCWQAAFVYVHLGPRRYVHLPTVKTQKVLGLPARSLLYFRFLTWGYYTALHVNVTVQNVLARVKRTRWNNGAQPTCLRHLWVAAPSFLCSIPNSPGESNVISTDVIISKLYAPVKLLNNCCSLWNANMSACLIYRKTVTKWPCRPVLCSEIYSSGVCVKPWPKSFRKSVFWPVMPAGSSFWQFEALTPEQTPRGFTIKDLRTQL